MRILGVDPTERRRESVARSRRKRNREFRLAALEAYGGKCTWCGEEDEDCLVIDHVNNDGAAHRREIEPRNGKARGAGHLIYRWLAKYDYPGGFQVLCANCNMKKSRGRTGP